MTITDMQAEIARLTKALHAAMAHPDFSYLVVPAGGMTPGGRAMLDDWEPNPEADVAPGDECYRRRKQHA